PGVSTTLTASGANTYSWSTSATTSLTVVNPTVASTYSVVGTDSVTGCSSTATTAVTIDTPTISISSPASICSGTIAPLTASGANTYTWSTASTGSAIAVSPTVTSSYSVTGTNTTGCLGTQTVQVIVNPNPTLTAVALPQASVCTGNIFTLTVNGAANYTIYSNPGSIAVNSPSVTMFSASYSPTVSTTYSVVGSYTNNCASSKTVAVTVLSCVGINEFNPSAAFINIYPNPTNGMFTVAVEQTGNTVELEVYNILGVLIKKQSAGSEKITANLQDEANGVYFVKLLENGKITHVARIVKQ
ncbi:MAG: T9SS type A sorting domain-containing protein, partial [Bacteroidetes bacterium]|nr:T9SS type A sorting domain-containing protein [Bacteroidota bacterium]